VQEQKRTFQELEVLLQFYLDYGAGRLSAALQHANVLLPLISSDATQGIRPHPTRGAATVCLPRVRWGWGWGWGGGGTPRKGVGVSRAVQERVPAFLQAVMSCIGAMPEGDPQVRAMGAKVRLLYCTVLYSKVLSCTIVALAFAICHL